MIRRDLLVMLGVSMLLSGASATPVMATARGSNMDKFVKRQAAKQMERREQKEKIENEQAKHNQKQKSDE
jgi:Sec-independent protein translocase protein TatA